MLCCWIEKPNSDAFKRHLARVADFLWVGEDGMKVQVNKTILSNSVLIRPYSVMPQHFVYSKLKFMNYCLSKGLCWSIMGCCFCCPSDISM
jgi:hypothetical protein